MLYRNITELIGNTPLLQIDPSVHSIPNVNLYAKLEYYNPFGSVKDRMALGILKDDIDSIRQGNQTIVEMSSGNTAKALQGIASIHGIPFKTITNRIKVPEVKDILKIMGTDIQELPGKSDCHDPNDPNDPLVYVHEEIRNHPGKVYFTSQYSNEKNIDAHYRTTGEELLNDLNRIDFFFGGVGTSGSTRGTSMRIQTRDRALRVIGVVASKGGYIPGIRNRDEVLEVGLFDPTFYTCLLEVNPGAAVDAEIELIQRSGILCGPTSGAVFAAVKDYFHQFPVKQPVNVVFIVCDRMEWYVSYMTKYRPDLLGIEKPSCASERLTEEDLLYVDELTPQEVYEKINRGVILIDSRSHPSFKTIHIDGSLNIPEETLFEWLENDVKFCPDKPIIFVCPFGRRSKRAAAMMKKLGYEAYSLKGGIFSWQDENFPIHHHL
ncbi:pyridoxal-phosphate dependent enzyme [Candidatus Uhrbacteria bacterium]|nr:pyridoxal-phosphate dependent enzyme [Candidatus Uhrbacteria bacterium]